MTVRLVEMDKRERKAMEIFNRKTRQNKSKVSKTKRNEVK